MVPLSPSKQESHLKIKNKIETLQQDSRFAFLVRPDADVSDNMKNIVAQYLRAIRN